MMDGHYVSGWLRPRSVRDAEDVVAGELEYRDVIVPGAGPSLGAGTLDYTTVGAARAAFEESVTVTHRRPARKKDNAVARRLMKRLRTWKCVIISTSAGPSRGGTEDPPFPVPNVGWWSGTFKEKRTLPSVTITIDLSF